jgi:hypothetical protein
VSADQADTPKRSIDANKKELVMMQRIGTFVCAALLLTAGMAWSADNAGRVEGTVAAVDPGARTITFTDGRIVHYDPRMVVLVDGRAVQLTEIRPGSAIVMAPPASVPVAVTDRIEGTVAAIDPVTRTVTLTDGRVLQYDPRSRVYVGNREVALTEVRPGSVILMMPGGPSTSSTVVTPVPGATSSTVVVPGGTSSTVVVPGATAGTIVTPGPTQQAMAQPPQALRTHPPIEAMGTIASVDRLNGIVTLQDGRMLRVTDGNIWQPVRLGTLQPGTQVYLSNAQPAGYRAAGAAVPAPTITTWTDRDVMARVQRVDPTGNRIILSDGTVVAVSPGTRMHMHSGQAIAVRDLRPGDEIVIHMREPATAAVVTGATTDVRAARPGDFASIDADWIVVVRRPEAP